MRRRPLPRPLPGITSGFGFNQSDYLWLLRTRPKVRQAFETVWGSGDLLVSYDGGNMFRPHAHPEGDPEWKTSGGWWHVDQNAHKPGHAGKCCVQGVVLLTDADASSGGLCVIPGSHNEFVSMCERNAMAKANKGVDYVPIPYDDPVLSQEEGWSPVLVGAKAGDMILWVSPRHLSKLYPPCATSRPCVGSWTPPPTAPILTQPNPTQDSRCVHCNTPSFATPAGGVGTSTDQAASAEAEGAGGGGADAGPELLRLAGYVCMTPASWATKEALDERVFCFEHRHGSSHWPVSWGTKLPAHRPHVRLHKACTTAQLTTTTMRVPPARVPLPTSALLSARGSCTAICGEGYSRRCAARGPEAGARRAPPPRRRRAREVYRVVMC